MVLLVALLGLAAPAGAEITPIAQDRSVEVQIGAHLDCAFFSCPPFPMSYADSDSATAPDLGPFDATVSLSGFPDCFLCATSATAAQTSAIGSDRIDLSLGLDASGSSFIGDETSGNPLVVSVSARASSRTEVRFAVDAPSRFAFSGSFGAELDGFWTLPPARFTATLWWGLPETGAPIPLADRSCEYACDVESFDAEGELEPGDYALVVTSEVYSAVGGYGPGNTEPQSFDIAGQLEASLVATDLLAVPIPAAWDLVAAGALLAGARLSRAGRAPLRRRRWRRGRR